MRGALVRLQFLATLTCSTAAFAQEAPKPGGQYRDYPISIEGQLSPFGGPLGMAGVALDIAVIPELSVAGGVGAGGFSTQWGAAIRPRLPLTTQVALAATLGYSRGDYKEFALDLAQGANGSYLYRDASWLNVDVGFDARFWNHVVVRPYMGVSQLVASQYPVWYEGGWIYEDYSIPFSEQTSHSRWPWLLYGGIALGFAIGLP